MKLCAISFKECWRDEQNQWYSSGGFPLQMSAIGSLFDEITLLITEVEPRVGGIQLPSHYNIVPLRTPLGQDFQRKLDVLLHLPQYISKMLRNIQKTDVVHVPLPGDLPLLGFIIALISRKHLIARYGGSWFSNSQTTFMNRFTRLLMRIYAGGRNIMLATGDFDAPPAQNIHWIFVTALSEYEIKHRSINLDRGLSTPPQITYIGRLSPEKGLDNLITALNILKTEHFSPLPKLLLIGDGPQRRLLEEKIAALGCNNLFSFVGQVDRLRLSEYLLKTDFCVQPSLSEGFSKAWLDAMAHGVPVITSEVGAARKVIGNHNTRGWLIPPNDIEKLVNQIKKIISEDINWKEMRQACYDYAQERTLERWAFEIGMHCSQQWGYALIDGKLHK